MEGEGQGNRGATKEEKLAKRGEKNEGRRGTEGRMVVVEEDEWRKKQEEEHRARLIEAGEKFERWRGGEMCKRLTGCLGRECNIQSEDKK